VELRFGLEQNKAEEELTALTPTGVWTDGDELQGLTLQLDIKRGKGKMMSL